MKTIGKNTLRITSFIAGLLVLLLISSVILQPKTNGKTDAVVIAEHRYFFLCELLYAVRYRHLSEQCVCLHHDNLRFLCFESFFEKFKRIRYFL